MNTYQSKNSKGGLDQNQVLNNIIKEFELIYMLSEPKTGYQITQLKKSITKILDKPKRKYQKSSQSNLK